MHDWLILVLLVVIEVILNIINPVYRFVGESMMTDLRYPLLDNTVPFWAVPVIAILLSFAIFLVYYLFRRDVYDLHQAILSKTWLINSIILIVFKLFFLNFLIKLATRGLLFSVLITGVITDAIKDAVGRPRPDFFWRCFPNGKPEYDSITRGVICHGDRSVIKECHKSFPRSFAGLGFIAWYMAGKISF